MEDKVIEYPTAKLAYDLGFRRKIGLGYRNAQYYNSDGILNGDVSKFLKDNSLISIPAPTQSLLQKWLREEHNIFVQVEIDRTSKVKFSVEIYYLNQEENIVTLNQIDWGLYRKYEEALESGLIQALSLI